MYDTATRVEMVKKRIRQRQREKEKRRIFDLSAICVLLSAALVGLMKTFSGTEQIALPGLYGSILLHEDAGGYVLVGVISFTAAVVITALCIKLRERERHRKDIERDNTPQQQEDKTE